MTDNICRYCNIVEVRNTRQKICPSCIIINAAKRMKWCSNCNTIKNWEDFGNNDQKLFGCSVACRLCISAKHIVYMGDREPFLKGLYRRCVDRTKSRNIKGRGHEMTWTLEEMKNRLIRQNDRCAVSGIPMAFGPNNDWQCSPERLSNELGYTDQNGAFVCLEFQLAHNIQATKRYVRSLCMVENTLHPRLQEIMSGNLKEPAWVTLS
jgi:hypothetical protein